MKKIIVFLFSPLVFASPSDYMKQLQDIDTDFFEAEEVQPAKPNKVAKKKRVSPHITDLEELYFQDSITTKASGIQKNKKKKVRSR